MMSAVKVECVVKASALIGEGPVWEESEQTLLFVDIAGRKIHRWSPTATHRIQSVETGRSAPSRPYLCPASCVSHLFLTLPLR